MSKRKGLREIEWGSYGGGDNHICIYDNGHINPSDFLKMVIEKPDSDIPDDARAALRIEHVRHGRFRPMSPPEAKSWGCDSGVLEVEDHQRGYPVTYVIF